MSEYEKLDRRREFGMRPEITKLEVTPLDRGTHILVNLPDFWTHIAVNLRDFRSHSKVSLPVQLVAFRQRS
jgi:hypothetical protein